MFQKLTPFAADLWKHRELLWQFTLRNVELRHRGSHLGLIWSFLNPLLMLGLYVFVFGYIFGGTFGILPNETKIDYALGVFFGLTLFHVVAQVLAISPTVIVGNPNFVKKVVFPLEVLPASHVGAALIHLVISLALLLAGILFFGPGITVEALWLPVILVPVVLLLLGIGWLFAALGVFLRDIGPVMQFLTMGLMFSSAVFFPAHKIPPDIWLFLRLNPVLLAIELARDAALWHRPWNFSHLGYLYVCALVVCYLGHAAFRRMKPAFADVL